MASTANNGMWRMDCSDASPVPNSNRGWVRLGLTLLATTVVIVTAHKTRKGQKATRWKSGDSHSRMC
jgi:hypothetical protein